MGLRGLDGAQVLEAPPNPGSDLGNLGGQGTLLGVMLGPSAEEGSTATRQRVWHMVSPPTSRPSPPRQEWPGQAPRLVPKGWAPLSNFQEQQDTVCRGRQEEGGNRACLTFHTGLVVVEFAGPCALGKCGLLFSIDTSTNTNLTMLTAENEAERGDLQSWGPGGDTGHTPYYIPHLASIPAAIIDIFLEAEFDRERG